MPFPSTIATARTRRISDAADARPRERARGPAMVDGKGMTRRIVRRGVHPWPLPRTSGVSQTRCDQRAGDRPYGVTGVGSAGSDGVGVAGFAVGFFVGFGVGLGVALGAARPPQLLTPLPLAAFVLPLGAT